MAYMVDGGRGNRPVFEELDEANKFANYVMKETGLVLAVTETSKIPTYTWCKTNAGWMAIPITYTVYGWENEESMASFVSNKYKSLSRAKKVFESLKGKYRMGVLRRETKWIDTADTNVSANTPIMSF